MFKEWCFKNGFVYNKQKHSTLSHVLMDGGSLSIPFDRLDDFYEKCMECIKSGHKIYVVEQKTKLYNFFLDIDYKDEEALDLDNIKSICKVICDKVKTLGGKDCIISVAEPKQVGNLIKTGIHLNWHGFVVDQEGALSLRDHIVSTLKIAYGSQDWNDIIDVAVYGSIEKQTQGAGFRMPWSHKIGKHEPCMGRGCDACNKTGKITQSPYLPIYKYTHAPLNMLTEISQEPTLEMLQKTTVRTECELPVSIKPVAKRKMNYVKEGGFTKTQTKNEVIDSEIIAHLQTFIRKNMEGQQNSEITHIFKNKMSYLISTTSHYCENLGREHNSNHIWFYLNKNTIMQKCFCTCETVRGRRSGFCKDFSGRRHVIPDKLVEKLYTEEDKKPSKTEVKPQPVINDDVNTMLTAFLNRYVMGQKETEVIGILRKRNIFTVETTATFCEKANEEHDFCVPFKIEKGILISDCPCKVKKYTPRGHQLFSKITNKLIPPKKK